MVQYKKDEINERIEKAALHVFFEKGFINAKIADIAAKAGISVGNIYRYFKNKDELFYTVIPKDFIEFFKKTLFEKIIALQKNGLSDYKDDQEYNIKTHAFYQFLLNNKEKFIILVDHGQGTVYSDFKRELVDFLVKTCMDNYIDAKRGENTMQNNIEDILRIVYNNLINMFSEILKQESSNLRTNNILQAINNYHLTGINELLL